MVIYTVRPGDTAYAIAQKYGITVQKLSDDNALTNPERLTPGQALVITVDSVNYTVQPGDSLYLIAGRYGVSIDSILAANPNITNPAQIQAGQTIVIPFPTDITRGIIVNGFVFPSVSDLTLERTLPHLTYLSIFSYEVLPDGSLSSVSDESVIADARAAGVAPLMTITNIVEGEGFDSDLAHTILTTESAQTALIDNILSTLKKGYSGLVIDFEYVYPYDRESYNQFLRRVVDALHPAGYIVITALAPKTSADQKGLLYEAHDYAFHGETADYVILMTYEWGYLKGPPLPVAPINEVKKVLDYAVTAIPSEKILMGIPNYGYDWTLPYVPGTSARPLNNTQAVNLAVDVGAAINFDETAQSPFFYYFEDGRQHIVWFEDARSAEAKLELVGEYDLGGVSYWTLMSFFPQNWWVLDSMYYTEKVL